MTLKNLLDRSRIGADIVGPDVEVSGITIDSRRVTLGALFVCMPSMTRESEDFLPEAKASGAAAAIVHSSAGLEAATAIGLTACRIPDQAFDDVLWRICDAFFDHPTRHMKVVGITGTNGKTTTAWILRDMLASTGLRTAYLGTLGFHLPDEGRELPNTTPFAVDLYNLLAEARDKGVQALAMEVSSHALAQRRADGVEFDAAVFTNLTQDHLDYHGTMEEYEAAKFRLFEEFPRQTHKRFVAALNGEDPVGRAWAHRIKTPGILFGTHPNLLEAIIAPISAEAPVAWMASGSADPAAFQAAAFDDHLRHLVCQPVEIHVDRIRVRLFTPNHEASHVADVALGGSYNVQNTASACAAMAALGYGLDEIAQALTAVRPVPGRFEAVVNDSGIGILVDYAHTPDALEKLLDAVRPLTQGRVITVFGCGGDRDRNKRPKMARAASERSDLTIVTSDNPRTEDPQAILDEIRQGIVPGAESVSILDRRDAVAHAVSTATPGDVVVIAGKGHENYQIIGREKIHMDDRELAREALARRSHS